MKNSVILLFSLSLALLSCGKETASGGSGETGGGSNKPASYTISGRISGNDGKLLSGVVVSDGHSCFKTGEDGMYYLNADLQSARYVFVSTPSGYSAPVKEGHAQFWQFLKDYNPGGDGKYTVNFTLNRITSPVRYTIFIFADPQPRKSTANLDKVAYHSLDCCEDMYRDMKELAASLGSYPVYGIGLGDIVHQDLSLLAQYKNGMSSTGIATYNVIGNHDQQHVLDQSDAEASIAFENKMGPVNYSFNLGGIHFLMLDNMISYGPGSGKYSDECATGLTDAIWEWVKNDLSMVSKSTTLMVCAHSPMMRLLGGKDRSGSHLSDLRKLLSNYAKAYVWAGHTHTSFNYVDKSSPVIESHTVSRATGALWTNEFLGANGTPRGYVVFSYDNGQVSWKFKPIVYQSSVYGGNGNGGRTPDYSYRDWDYNNGKAVLKAGGTPLDDSYQMQLFAPGTYGDKNLYANVFLWDELWDDPKLSVDGVPYGKMKRVVDKDWKYSYSDWDITSFYSQNTAIGSEFTPDKNNNESMFRMLVNEDHGTGTVTHSSTITW